MDELKMELAIERRRELADRNAGNVVTWLQRRQDLLVACPEEIAFGQGWIDAEELQALARPLANNFYGRYLLSLLQ